jgi:dienelactone hydrolase
MIVKAIQMTRRDFLESASLVLPAAGLTGAAPAAFTGNLPGTGLLTWEGDLSERMMDGAHRFVERKIAESASTRVRRWKRDLSSRTAYEQSVEANRARLRAIIGVVDSREPASMERVAAAGDAAMVAETSAFRVHQVRWPVFEDVFGEGLWLEPARPPAGYVVALPDADQTPEQIAGLVPGISPEKQFARRLAANGFSVVIPTLIDRTARWSGHPDIRLTDQPHREWIYRQAFHMGRHVIGYEVQKVLAVVDWFERERAVGVKIGVAGYAEGGLIALYAAAVDPRIDAALVSGYFDNRQHVWSEPIYRNVWALLDEFGDAEIATLIAPRGLTIEYSRVPEITNPRGDLRTPAFDSVRREYERIESLTRPGFQSLRLISGEDGVPCGPGSQRAVEAFAGQLGGPASLPIPAELPSDLRHGFSPDERQKRQVRGMEKHVQSLIRASEKSREQFFLYKVMPELASEDWSTEPRHKTFSAARFIDGAKPYRRYFHEEVLGRFDEPLLPANARTRRIYDRPRWTGYEVILDVWPEVFAWGILLVPKDLRPGERRPVVVCQHGRQGVPRDVVEGDVSAYFNFAARLADEGFITFAPHNLYRGEDRYRWLCRKANGVKATLFSFILSQHEQILRWLGTLPFVDAARIGFYGLSYGGETAVRVPTILEGYSLSICSGDFNTWNEKVAATDQRFSFMYTIEWEMPYFNMGSTFDYAEMAYLMLPRPFMVERGHNDRVGRDQWVAHQYAKVRWLYAQLGLADRTEIEYFNGGHAINGEGTFRFLRRHLNWPPS